MMSSVHKGVQVLAGRLATTTTMVSMRSLPAVLGSLSSSSSSSSSTTTTTTTARNASSVSATSSSAQAVEDVKVTIPEGIRVEFKYPFLYSFGPLGVKQANLSMFEHVGIRLVNEGDGDQKNGAHLSFASYTPSGTYSFAARAQVEKPESSAQAEPAEEARREGLRGGHQRFPEGAGAPRFGIPVGTEGRDREGESTLAAEPWFQPPGEVPSAGDRESGRDYANHTHAVKRVQADTWQHGQGLAEAS
eukprot:CAMPEP_0197471646 /NCGR_PEP_ID=MMETSP1309-20131121/2600_1 /TAXON_ID=464262 /ORGANISM="Genus nov. species nov., Strain RCC998" /LENGTH=246 /DNA_ID=CAMNT_0043009533 /DNA_START=38 /DNA_END=777 /DNA_ORIENTATION=+